VDEVLTREFVIATNQMYRSLTIYDEDRSRRRLLECARIGCWIFTNDMYLQALVEDARTFQERRRFHRRDMRRITASTHFEHFLEIERRLLEEAGTDRGLTEAIIAQCQEARKATKHGKFDAYAFNRALLQLRLAVCGVFAELQEATFEQRPSYQLSDDDIAQTEVYEEERAEVEREREEGELRPVDAHRLASVLKGVCGCVLVGLDASSLAPTVGLSASGSAVSIAVGGAIVGQAITELSRAGCYPRLLRRFRRQNTEV
jgi:hypothetical protein